jgi:hypothetical protein
MQPTCRLQSRSHHRHKSPHQHRSSADHVNRHKTPRRHGEQSKTNVGQESRFRNSHHQQRAPVCPFIQTTPYDGPRTRIQLTTRNPSWHRVQSQRTEAPRHGQPTAVRELVPVLAWSSARHDDTARAGSRRSAHTLGERAACSCR